MKGLRIHHTAPVEFPTKDHDEHIRYVREQLYAYRRQFLESVSDEGDQESSDSEGDGQVTSGFGAITDL